MKITILTMFPQMFDSFREGPVVQRAIRKGSLELSVVDLRRRRGHGDAMPACAGRAQKCERECGERKCSEFPEHNCCCIVTCRPSVYTEAGTPPVGAGSPDPDLRPL